MQDKCSFCGRTRNEVNLLIAGADGFICDDCATQAYEIVQEEINQSLFRPICHRTGRSQKASRCSCLQSLQETSACWRQRRRGD